MEALGIGRSYYNTRCVIIELERRWRLFLVGWPPGLYLRPSQISDWDFLDLDLGHENWTCA